MLAGFLTSVLWVLVFKANALGLYEAIPGFAAGFLSTFIVSRMDHRSRSARSRQRNSA
jgi:Na+/proline symporter